MTPAGIRSLSLSFPRSSKVRRRLDEHPAQTRLPTASSWAAIQLLRRVGSQGYFIAKPACVGQSEMPKESCGNMSAGLGEMPNERNSQLKKY